MGISSKNAIKTIEILHSIGFYIKLDKPKMLPKQQITFLGVIIGSLHKSLLLAVCKKSESGGMWTKQEQALHINAVEHLNILGSYWTTMQQ